MSVNIKWVFNIGVNINILNMVFNMVSVDMDYKIYYCVWNN